MPKERLRGLDALRGIAALGVVLFHYTHPHPEIFGAARTAVELIWGRIGVHLFFIISGFVIFMTLERAKELSGFAVGRFARLYPAYVAGMIFTTAMQAWGGLPVLATARSIGPNLIMMAQPLGVDCIEMSYWTLAYELWFYVWAALFVRLCAMRAIEGCCLVAMAIGPISLFVTKSPLLHVALLFGYAQYFTIGIMFYLIRTGRARPITYATIAVALASCFVLKDMNVAALAFVGAITIAAALAWLGVSATLPSWLILLLAPLGEISYSLYLIHPSAGLAIMHRLTEAGWPIDLTVPVVVTLVIAAATVLNRTIERPTQRWIRSAYDRWKMSGSVQIIKQTP